MKQSLTELFTHTLLTEASALEKVAYQVDELSLSKIAAIFQFLKQQKGLLVCSGVGKSGWVAQKLASTFSSIGLPSSFLHPVDALHGDLGRVRSIDAFLFISKSGTTVELLELVPYLPMPKGQIIGLLGRMNSPLFEKSGVVINCSIEREACLNNQAPTTSTTAAMAVGDALAVLFESLVGLSKEAFAMNHPAGFLGKSLKLKVADLMIKAKECPVLFPDAHCREVIIRMTERPVGLCALVNQEQELLGIVVDGDLRRLLSSVTPDADLLTKSLNLPVDQMMNKNPVTITPSHLAYDALHLMEHRDRQITALPVLDGKKFVGIIRLHDLIRAGLS